MNINIIMNSISDAHSNKRIKEFENQGFDVNIFGFNRGIASPERNDISIVGNFTNTTQYYKRIVTYINGIRKAFKLAGDMMTFGTIKAWIQLYLPLSSVKSVNISMKSATWYTPIYKMSLFAIF